MPDLDRSIIRILGADGSTRGTGFMIASGLAVTCAHVAAMAFGFKEEDAGQARGRMLTVECYWNKQHCLAQVDAEMWSPVERDDVAFLRIANLPKDAEPLPLKSGKGSAGHSYASLGFPKQPEMFEARRASEMGGIGGLIPAKRKHPLLQLKGDQIFFGMSGAPILDTSPGVDGVVGMVSKGLDDKYVRFAYATTADTIAGLCPEVRLAGEARGAVLPPRGVLPECGPLPQGSRMLFPPNELFTGRVPDLLALAEKLVYADSPGRVSIAPAAALSGMGGIGKSQLAAEFCYRYGQFFHGVHWVSALEGDLTAGVALCGAAMGLDDWPEKPIEQAARTLRAWQKDPNRLVVLDNLEEPNLLQDWLPGLGAVRLLITARREKWPRGLAVQVQPLALFPRAESLALLRKLAPRLEKVEDADLDRLAAYLGDLPLALDLAGRYLDEAESMLVRAFLEELQRRTLAHPALAEWAETSPTRHATSLAQTFELSWSQLDPEKPAEAAARRMFFAAGYCAPNTPIPAEILRGVLKDVEDAVCDRAASRLADLGLLRRGGEGIQIHPLLAAFARLVQGEEKAVLEQLADNLATLSNQALDTELPSDFLPLRAHVEAAAGYSETAEIADAGTLWNNFGYHLKMVAEYERAKACCERALAIGEQVYGAEHPTVALRLNNLGTVLQDLGDLEGAKACCERALAIDEKVYGPEHPDVGRDLNSLGLALKTLGDLAGAKACYERALTISEKVYGPEHPYVANRVNNLGLVLRALGDLEGARACCERAVDIGERVNGPEHPEVARYVNNLGGVLQDLGDLPGARTCYERALTISEKVYGLDHPDVAIRFNNLGMLLRDQGDLAGARANIEQALAIFKRFLPEGHPNIKLVQRNLELVEREMREKRT